MMKYILLTGFLSLFMKYGLAQEYRIDTTKVAEFANEVYLDAPQYAQQTYFPAYIEKIKQVTILHKDQVPQTEVLLSSVRLVDKYNSSLGYDKGSGFSPETFNPLKYFFNFYTLKEAHYFIVDGTDYVVKISPRQ